MEGRLAHGILGNSRAAFRLIAAYEQGIELLRQERWASALPLLQQAVLDQPERSHAWYLLGVALVRQQLWLEAAEALERATELEPGFQPAWPELCRALLELDRLPQAASAASRPLPADPFHAVAAGAALWRHGLAQGDGAAALQAIIRLRGLHGQQPWLAEEALRTASAWLLHGHSHRAQVLLQALSTRPESSEALANPFPRRLALLLQLVLALAEPEPPPPQLLQDLRASLWAPPHQLEQQLWQPITQPALLWLRGRCQGDPERPPLPRESVKALLDALPAVEPEAPPKAHQKLYKVVASLAKPQEPWCDPALPPAQQWMQRQFRRLELAQADLPALLLLWPEILAGLPQLPSGARRHCREALQEHLQGFSELVLDRPNRLVTAPGQPAEALALREQGVDLLLAISQALAELDGQAPAPPRSGPRRRWLLLAAPDLPQCVLYRVEQKLQQLQASGGEGRMVWRDQLNAWTWSEQLLWADAVIVCRLPALAPVLQAIHAARRLGLPVLYDIDDLLFDPEYCPPDFESYGGTISAELHRRFVLDVPLFRAAAQLCDGLIVSTSTLERRWRELHPESSAPVWVLPNCAPPELLESVQPPHPPTAPPRLVLASGTKAHKLAWQQELAPAVAVLLERHPELQLDLLGWLTLPGLLVPYADRIRLHPFTSYRRYLQLLGQATIGLVVLEPGIFTDAKSAIRWMEFSLLGLASVLSPTATYRELLKPGEHALFARGTEQWISAVEQLLADPQQRQAMAERAQRHALAQFGRERPQAFWQPWLQAPAPRRRQRLLVLNVFFAPQSVGGATRVVQDQLRGLLERAGDRYEITVLCSDQAPWQQPPETDDADIAELEPWEQLQPIPLDGHGWHGARVLRLSQPPRPWREHRDASMLELCRRWLLQEGFDLIHAHCLQVLSIAPLQAAAELGIPYVITLHDGWWLSPRQFLTTVTGQPVDPADPIGHYDHPELQDPALLARDRVRRQELEQVLAGAAARLAVSEPFAALHRQAGIADVGVLENDWQPMATGVPKGRRPVDQPLRCCYLGGLAVHKGFAVLQAACLQAQPKAPGLVLTVVDGSLQPGQSYQQQWGSVVVTFVPSVPMDQMAGFYSEHDVLLAPSIWPESYGLVSREALSSGLWVVAAQAGAMADPIQPGLNGEVVPSGDAAALSAVLECLSAEHPAPQPLLRFAQQGPDSVEQLLKLYELLL